MIKYIIMGTFFLFWCWLIAKGSSVVLCFCGRLISRDREIVFSGLPLRLCSFFLKFRGVVLGWRDFWRVEVLFWRGTWVVVFFCSRWGSWCFLCPIFLVAAGRRRLCFSFCYSLLYLWQSLCTLVFSFLPWFQNLWVFYGWGGVLLW